MGDENSHGSNRINKINSETKSDYNGKPRDYLIFQSLDKQANVGQNNDISLELSLSATSAFLSIEPKPDSIKPEPILSESSSSQAKIPSSTSSEPSQCQSKARKALIIPEEASRICQQRRRGN